MTKTIGPSTDERCLLTHAHLSSNHKLRTQLREQAVAFLGESLFHKLRLHYDSEALPLAGHFFVKLRGRPFDDAKASDVALLQEVHILALSAILQAHCPSWRDAQESPFGPLAHKAAQSCMAAARTVQGWAKKMDSLRSTAPSARLSQHRAFLEEQFNLMFVPSLATSIRAKYPALA